jgi:hypothetical protein
VKAISLSKFHFPKGCFTLVLGNEEFGCSKQLVEAADTIVLLRVVPLCPSAIVRTPADRRTRLCAGGDSVVRPQELAECCECLRCGRS